jgi:hypothetical protein
MSKLQYEVISILCMSENHPVFFYREEKMRLGYYYTRNVPKIIIEESGNFYKLNHFDIKCSFIITLSEIKPLMCIKKFIYYIFYWFSPLMKYKTSGFRNFFLWGSRGAIYRGLDLLTEIFNNRDDIALYICGLSEIEKKIFSFQVSEDIME